MQIKSQNGGYARTSFGLTGAPSTFAHMTGQHLYDLLVKEVMELFVDDGGAAADNFPEMMSKLCLIFTSVCERGLSLSASKLKFFMTTAMFTGTTIGPKGIQPDLSKLTAIVNWRTLESALNLVSFLGLTGSVLKSSLVRFLTSKRGNWKLQLIQILG
jgi:hypothetical protein